MRNSHRRAMLRGAVALVFGLFVAAALPSAGNATTIDEIISRGKVTIAIDTTTPPYGMIDDNMQPTGFDIELAQLIGTAMGVPVEFVTVTSPGRIPALLTNRADMVVSIFSITAQRALQVSFSIPYASQSSVVLAPKSTAIKSAKDLVGLKVGVTRGTGEDGLLTAAAKDTPGIEILRFDDYASISQAMLSGQIDAMGGGDYGDIYLKKSAKGDDFELKYILKTFYFGIGVRKDSPELLQWLNTFIFTLRQDGTLDRLSLKYRKTPLPQLPTF
ncbi:transporter substrate-binding domain-containing protein [Kaistia dalseonensis]|uniref:Polar amino acid transport system substrate-binding protein n=1 Tax=Kaistia dalseonensis TaxID=410840 RepID=A0ABU0H2V8_9HYPH|nr:transporter substrate-binding domain-containing protein [Kaistia dalseonensis]MCX5494061.1 transporter substrate-binding domain-containing protein [Kaistia dalseonensis]MDQ0436639.1 polar amino acid transport system substrate-binding protein [Kaistia dalseonensis]